MDWPLCFAWNAVQAWLVDNFGGVCEGGVLTLKGFGGTRSRVTLDASGRTVTATGDLT